MEHCLYEKSTLQSVIQFSNLESDVELTVDMTDALLQRRGHKKMQQIMQQVFYGSLELEIFSSFDPRGEDSLVGLQRRLAAVYVPHDQPNHKNLSPLLDIFSENAQGVRLAMHRYFLSEVYSAGLYREFRIHEKPQLLLSSAHAQTLGKNLRAEFLDLGATVDAESSLRKFNSQTLESPGSIFDLYKY